MKLELRKEKIVEAVSKAEKICSKNSTLSALECILFEVNGDNVKIKATNIDLSVSILIPIQKKDKDGKTLIPASTLNSFLSSLPKNDSVISFETKGNNIHITSESTDTVINSQSLDDFPDIKEEKAEKIFKIDSNDFINGLNSVWYSTAISGIKPELSSVYIYSEENELVFVATDSFRLAEKRIKIKKNGDFESLLIPYKNVVDIVRVLEGIDEEISLSFMDDQLIVFSDSINIISRVVDGTFPDYKQIIPKETKTKALVLKEDLAQSLKISNIFSDNFNQVIFSLFPEDSIFEVNSTSNEVGETKNILKSKLSGEVLKISFNGKYVVDSFNSIKSESISMKFSGVDKPVIIQGVNDSSFLYLVMPMNK